MLSVSCVLHRKDSCDITAVVGVCQCLSPALSKGCAPTVYLWLRAEAVRSLIICAWLCCEDLAPGLCLISSNLTGFWRTWEDSSADPLKAVSIPLALRLTVRKGCMHMHSPFWRTLSPQLIVPGLHAGYLEEVILCLQSDVPPSHR